jgi:hypothetical protein
VFHSPVYVPKKRSIVDPVCTEKVLKSYKFSARGLVTERIFGLVLYKCQKFFF